jgi:multiple sugar transport system permease protein
VRDRRNRLSLPGLLALYVLLIAVSGAVLLPLCWMLKISLQSPSANPSEFTSFRGQLHFENYRRVLFDMNVGRALLNSFFVTTTVTFGLVATSSLAAYAFARMRFPGRNAIFWTYLATMMVPTAVMMVPLFLLLRELRLIDTYWALILPSMFSAYGVFLLRQFFLGIPRELEDAAVIDGCSTFGIMWPLIVAHSKELYTLPLALAQFHELFGVRWTFLMAGSVIMIIPMMIIFIIGQRHFVEGIQVGAVKG